MSIAFLRFLKYFLILDIEHAMAITLKIGVSHLLTEFLADALVFFGPLQTAGAVTTGAFQTFLDHLDHFLVIIQTYSHGVHILSDFIIR